MPTVSTQPDGIALVARRAVLWVLGATTALGVVASISADRHALYGVLIGGGIILAVFVFGAIGINLVTKVMPQASIIIALMTYIVQLLALAVVASEYGRSDLADVVPAGWIAAGVLTATLAWIGGSLRAAARVPLAPISAPHTWRLGLGEGTPS